MAKENPRKFELEVDGVPAQAMALVGFRAQERLSDVGRVFVDLVSARLDPQALLGRSASLYLHFKDNPARHFHGLVWSAELEPLDDKNCKLRLEIAPRLATLSLGKNARIFTDLTLVDVVTEVLEQSGLTGDAVEWQAEPGPVHECVIQYDESDYDFVRRLLFEEGIGFLIQNDPDSDRVIFFDDHAALLPVEGLDTLVDRRRQDMRYDTAFELRQRVSATPDAVMLRDYDLKDPEGSPDGERKEGDAPSRQVYAHPAGHLELDTRAQRMLERVRARGLRFEAGSYWPQLEAGRTLHLDSELRGGLQEEVVLLSVEHEGQLSPGRQGASYSNRFTAMPRSLPYRPEQAPAPPAMAGAQRAFITGSSGQELHGDDYGRAKIRFPWDRSGMEDDRSSHWVRVGQLPMPGSMVVPRVGFEVLLGCEFGDLDRPYVTGHLYSEDHPAPYGTDELTTSSLQSGSTDGGAGANELRMDSSSGGEQILMNASYDMTVRVENQATETVAKHENQEVGVNTSRAVTSDYTANVGAVRSLNVGAMQNVNVGADYNDGVGGDHSLSVGAARNVMVKGDQVENIGGSLSRTIGSAQTVTTSGAFERKVVGDSAVTVGAAWAETVAASKNSTVSGSRADTVAALKMIDAKAVSIGADGAYGEALGSLKVKTGKDRTDAAGDKFKLEAKGGLSIKAADINLVAADKLTFSAGGVTFTLAKAGEVKIKAKEITIKNSKAFKQITHKSN